MEYRVDIYIERDFTFLVREVLAVRKASLVSGVVDQNVYSSKFAHPLIDDGTTVRRRGDVAWHKNAFSTL
jgi:hypothetical protein